VFSSDVDRLLNPCLKEWMGIIERRSKRKKREIVQQPSEESGRGAKRGKKEKRRSATKKLPPTLGQSLSFSPLAGGGIKAKKSFEFTDARRNMH